MLELLEYQFMQHALLASLLASVVCAVVGVLVVEKRLVMMSGGIAHTAYGGVGLGYLCGFNPMIGAVLFSVCASLGIGAVRRRGSKDGDVAIALFWSLGMSLGIVFTSMMDGYPPDMTSYLFGNILSVTKGDLFLMLALTIVTLLVVVPFFNDWKTYLFDEEFARLMGMPALLMENVLLVLVALSVVVLIRVAGIILVIALLTAPAGTAAFYSRSLSGRMVLSVFFSLLFCIGGIALSVFLDIASGASIVVVSVLAYFLSRLIKRERH